MSLLTISDFAAICQMPEKNVHTARVRGKVVFTPDPANPKKNLVDNQNEINKAFVVKRKIVLAKSAEPPLPDTGLDDFDAGEQEKPKTAKKEGKKDLLELTEEEKQLRVEVLKREVVKRDIDIDKKNALLIPTDMVKGYVRQYNVTIIQSFKTVVEKTIDLLSVKYKLTPTDATNLRRDLFAKINEGAERATKEMSRNIKNIQSEYSETRAAGERK